MTTSQRRRFKKFFIPKSIQAHKKNYFLVSSPDVPLAEVPVDHGRPAAHPSSASSCEAVVSAVVREVPALHVDAGVRGGGHAAPGVETGEKYNELTIFHIF